MNKKEIQRKRIMRYFIEATHEIIEKEGIESVTIRKVADIAGYNSATLYNYFENLEHLVFFASMKYLKEYALNLPRYIANSKDALDRYLNIWKCFCHYSFKKPKRYYTIFFDKYNALMQDTIKDYYNIFSTELDQHFKDLLPMFTEQNLYSRNLIILKHCSEEGFISCKNIDSINEMTLLIYQGMLTHIINGHVDYTVDEAVDKTLFYIQHIIQSFEDQ